MTNSDFDVKQQPINSFQCPQCEAALKGKASLVGRVVSCPSCRFQFIVPQADNASRETRKPDVSQLSTQVDGQVSRENSVDEVQTRTKHGDNEGVKYIDKYRLIRPLGRGGFGEVWLARDIHLNRSVALKLPIFSPTEDRKRKRLLTEAQSAGRLGHPNIVTLYDSGVIGDQCYLAIEYIEGQTLDVVCREKVFTFSEAAELIVILARAMGYAHQEKIIHRDIKPQNIIINSDGIAKIVDFGLAKRMDSESSETVEGAVLGTPAYMSPEQAKGANATIGPATDQYSLGVVLYWLLTNQTPFAGPTAAMLAQIIQNSPPSPSSLNPGIPETLEAVCMKALNKEPSHRYLNCIEFARDLERFLNGESPTACPERAWQKCVRITRRNPLVSCLAILVCVLFFVGLALTFEGQRRAWEAVSNAREDERAIEMKLTEQRISEETAKQQMDLLRDARDRSTRALKDAEKYLTEIELQNTQIKRLIDENKRLAASSQLQIEEIKLNQNKRSALVSELQSTQVSLEALADEASKESKDTRILKVAGLIIEEKYGDAIALINQERESSSEQECIFRLLKTLASQLNQLKPIARTKLTGKCEIDWFDELIEMKGNGRVDFLDSTTLKMVNRLQQNDGIFVRSSNTAFFADSKGEQIVAQISDEPMRLARVKIFEDPRDNCVMLWTEMHYLYGGKPIWGLCKLTGNNWRVLWRSDHQFTDESSRKYFNEAFFGNSCFPSSDLSILFANQHIVVQRILSEGQTNKIGIDERILVSPRQENSFVIDFPRQRRSRELTEAIEMLSKNSIMFEFTGDYCQLRRGHLGDWWQVFVIDDKSFLLAYKTSLGRFLVSEFD